ncbi:MAG: L-serine ammonia-lyase, iron-sulfur-dependent subunit beta [Clostridia bacterium]|nr:L-serine ammonia-lyase, iron-sulfur-dependent subunit beta [Clostridia bacterium]
MESYGIFDVIGPIMIGPSSSHTAGANRIGYMARAIYGKKPHRVEFHLHGSFYKTRKGHGTDRALLAGVMGIAHDDSRIRDAFEIAKQRGIEYAFLKADLGDVHPNTVKICMYDAEGARTKVVGSSVGGGKIVITKIDATDVEIDGEYSALITKHIDRPGIISKITKILADYEINIAFMKVFRHSKRDTARLVIQVDEIISEHAQKSIESLEDVLEVKFIKSMKESSLDEY